MGELERDATRLVRELGKGSPGPVGYWASFAVIALICGGLAWLARNPFVLAAIPGAVAILAGIWWALSAGQRWRDRHDAPKWIAAYRAWVKRHDF
jgi:hypothetical protein